MELKDKKLYYVGGVVRDKILGISSLDTDYCYEGDAIAFAQTKGLEILQTNPDFGTVRVNWDGKQVDIASTRKEFYPEKGKLPVVTDIGCSIQEDVLRRDFTINSMAIRTTDGEFFDYLGGVNDINKKLIRVLHKNSFIDDPTRIIRALKFSLRFGFKLDKLTEQYQIAYLSNINYDMSYFRIKKELIETFSSNIPNALHKFIDEKIYKLLSKNYMLDNINFQIPLELQNYSGDNLWLIYMSLFDLSNLALTKKEKNILNYAMQIENGIKSDKFPIESLLICKLRRECNNAKKIS